jgi:hypothetical protein
MRNVAVKNGYTNKHNSHKKFLFLSKRNKAYYANTHTALCYIPLSLAYYWTFTRRETVSGNYMLIDHATAQKNGAPF